MPPLVTLADNKHYAKAQVFRSDPDQLIEIVQTVTVVGRWQAPEIHVYNLPRSMAAIDAQMWATAMLWAADRYRRMHRYTGRPSD